MAPPLRIDAPRPVLHALLQRQNHVPGDAADIVAAFAVGELGRPKHRT